MREAIGNGLLMNLVIVIVSIVILFFVGILSYSKAYRIKNRIIEVIEEFGDYNSSAVDMISTDLKNVGYYAPSKKNCNETNENTTSYNYCIYRIDNQEKVTGSGKTNTVEDGSYYYQVVTYVQFQFPVIGNLIKIPVKGETKILGKKYLD